MKTLLSSLIFLSCVCFCPSAWADTFGTDPNQTFQIEFVPIGSPGHHAITLEATGFILRATQQTLIDYFDTCRRMRNQVNYDVAGVVSEAQANELLEKGKEFRRVVEDWVSQKHP